MFYFITFSSEKVLDLCKMLSNSRQLKFLKNYRNVNVILNKGDRALSKLITLLISNKKEFNHFFKSRSSDIVLLKL